MPHIIWWRAGLKSIKKFDHVSSLKEMTTELQSSAHESTVVSMINDKAIVSFAWSEKTERWLLSYCDVRYQNLSLSLLTKTSESDDRLMSSTISRNNFLDWNFVLFENERVGNELNIVMRIMSYKCLLQSTTVYYRYKCDDFRCLSVSCVVSGGCTPLGSPPKSICLYSWQSLKRRFQTMFWWWWWQQRNDKDDNRWKETNRWTTGNTETREKGDSLRLLSLLSLSSRSFPFKRNQAQNLTNLWWRDQRSHPFFFSQFLVISSSLFSLSLLRCFHLFFLVPIALCSLILYFAKHLLCPHSFSSSSFHPYAWFSYVRRSSYTPLNFLTWSSWTLGVILVSVTDEKRSKWISQISFPWIPHTSQVLWNKTDYWSPVVSRHSSLQTIVIWSS